METQNALAIVTLGLLTLSTICRCQTLEEIKALSSIMKNYDRRLTPTIYSGDIDKPTIVNCTLAIRSLWSLSHQTMDFQVDLYLYQQWIDPRLDHSNFSRILDLNDEDTIKQFWIPDIYFPNSRAGTFQTVAVPNILLRIYPEYGKLMLMHRVTMKFSCMMDLRKYPFDYQRCIMEISTFAKTDKEVELRWGLGKPIYSHPKLRELPNFIIEDLQPTICDEHYSIGNYSCLEANIYLHRRIGYHLVQNYIPTILIVAISWVSFWMDVDAVPGRICLGITTLLTVTSKVTGVQQSMPEISYVKAIDVWMGVCTAFVFSALCEFILSNYQYRKEKKSRAKVQTSPEVKIDPTSPESAGLEPPPSRVLISGNKIDRISRFAFPVSFLFFNLVYWPYYLVSSSSESP